MLMPITLFTGEYQNVQTLVIRKLAVTDTYKVTSEGTEVLDDGMLPNNIVK